MSLCLGNMGGNRGQHGGYRGNLWHVAAAYKPLSLLRGGDTFEGGIFEDAKSKIPSFETLCICSLASCEALACCKLLYLLQKYMCILLLLQLVKTFLGSISDVFSFKLNLFRILVCCCGFFLYSLQFCFTVATC